MNDAASREASRRTIRRRDLAFLQHELDCWQNSNLISGQQVRAIKNLYEPEKSAMSQVLVGLGAMLVGLGFLSYIAANWMEFSRIFRVGLILGLYSLSVLSAWLLEPSYLKTSRAFLFLGSFIYGGGIFLIAQMFNEGGHYTDALFWWMAGVAPAALIFKDRLQLSLLQAITVIYLNGLYQPWNFVFRYYGYERYFLEMTAFLWSILRHPEPLLVVLVLWALWRFAADRWNFGFRTNVFITLNLLVIYAFRFFNDFAMVMVFCVLIGILLGVCAFGYRKWDLGGWGIVLMGIAGLVLTVPEVWHRSRFLGEHMLGQFETLMESLTISPEVALSVGMTILLCVATLYFIHKGFTVAAPLFCLLILRCYFDRFYDFMSKAMFFTVGGLLLIGMGFWMERTRKHRRQRQKLQSGQSDGEVRP